MTLDAEAEERIVAMLISDELLVRLIRGVRGGIQQILRAALVDTDPRAQLTSYGEYAGTTTARQIELGWRLGPDGEIHRQVLSLPQLN